MEPACRLDSLLSDICSNLYYVSLLHIAYKSLVRIYIGATSDSLLSLKAPVLPYNLRSKETKPSKTANSSKSDSEAQFSTRASTKIERKNPTVRRITASGLSISLLNQLQIVKLRVLSELFECAGSLKFS